MNCLVAFGPRAVNNRTNLGGRRKIRDEGETAQKIREEGENLGKKQGDGKFGCLFLSRLRKSLRCDGGQ